MYQYSTLNYNFEFAKISNSVTPNNIASIINNQQAANVLSKKIGGKQ